MGRVCLMALQSGSFFPPYLLLPPSLNIFVLFCVSLSSFASFSPFSTYLPLLFFISLCPFFFPSPFPLSAYLMYILWTQRGHIVVTIFMFCMCAVPNLVFIQCISALSSQSSHPNNGNIPIVHHLFTATVFHLVLIISYTLLPGKDIIRHSLVNKIKNQLYLL